MKKISGVLAVIGSLVLVVAFAYAQQSTGQQSDPGMQRSDTSSSQSQMGQQGASATKDPQTIKQVQEALSQQGFYKGPADGKMGSKTKSALKKFQKSQGMQASGKLDQQTLAALGVQGAGAGTGGQQDMSSSGSGVGGQEDMSSSQSGAGGQQDQQSNHRSGSQQSENK